MTKDDEETVKEFINSMLKVLDDPIVPSDLKGSKENPYIYICNSVEYEKAKSMLNDEDMILMADGWVKYVVVPIVKFNSEPKVFEPPKELIRASMPRATYYQIFINPKEPLVITIDTTDENKK